METERIRKRTVNALRVPVKSQGRSLSFSRSQASGFERQTNTFQGNGNSNVKNKIAFRYFLKYFKHFLFLKNVTI